MGIEENKNLVRRMVAECVNTHRADLLGQFVSPDLIIHPGTPGRAPDTEGVDGFRRAFEGFRRTFPDLRVELEQMVAEGDLVAARWTATGTHTGELAGIAPTGAAVTWGGTDMYRLVETRIVELWRNDDLVELLHQLGRDVIPADG